MVTAVGTVGLLAHHGRLFMVCGPAGNKRNNTIKGLEKKRVKKRKEKRGYCLTMEEIVCWTRAASAVAKRVDE